MTLPSTWRITGCHVAPISLFRARSQSRRPFIHTMSTTRRMTLWDRLKWTLHVRFRKKKPDNLYVQNRTGAKAYVGVIHLDSEGEDPGDIVGMEDGHAIFKHDTNRREFDQLLAVLPSREWTSFYLVNAKFVRAFVVPFDEVPGPEGSYRWVVSGPGGSFLAPKGSTVRVRRVRVWHVTSAWVWWKTSVSYRWVFKHSNV